MRQFSILLISIAIAVGFASCDDPYDVPSSNERAILDITTNNQIGAASVARETNQFEAYVSVDAGKVSLSAVELSFLVSNGASIQPSSGTSVDFTQSADSSAVYTVTSESGEVRNWKVFVKPFVNPLQGSWTITSYRFKWDDWNGWGNSGEDELAGKLEASATGLDDVITFGEIEGVTDNGLVFGLYERTVGTDGLSASYVYDRTGEDWAGKFNQLPVGQGQWQINVDNSITFTVGGKSYTSKPFEAIDANNLKLPLDPGPQDGGRINWDDYYGDNTNKFCVTYELWYTLEKQ